MKSNKNSAGAGAGSGDSTKDALLNVITCPITHQIFRRPVVLTSGTIIEQEAADTLFRVNPRTLKCPVMSIPISRTYTNFHAYNHLIDTYVAEHLDAEQYPEYSTEYPTEYRATAAPTHPIQQQGMFVPNAAQAHAAPQIDPGSCFLPLVIGVKPTHTPNATLKLAAIGDSNSGKTTLLAASRYPAAMSDVGDVSAETLMHGDRQYKWTDTAGQARYQHLVPNLIRGSDAAIIMASTPAAFQECMQMLLSTNSGFLFYEVNYSDDNQVVGVSPILNSDDPLHSAPTLNDFTSRETLQPREVNMSTEDLHGVITDLLTHIETFLDPDNSPQRELANPGL